MKNLYFQRTLLRREEDVWLVLRCLLAALVSVHGWYRFFDHGVLPFARGMDQEIFLGYYLVFILQGMEMFGSILLARGRFVTVMSLIFAVIYSCSIYFYHSHFGWFQNGGKQDGAEYAVALIVCFLALVLRYFPTSWTSIKTHYTSQFPTIHRPSFDWRFQWSWAALRWMLLVLIGIHVIYRIVQGSVSDMVAVMPGFVPNASALAILATLVQALALLAIALNRGRTRAYIALAILYCLAIVFHHAWQGWKVSGTRQDGTEYVFLLMVVLVCCAWVHRQGIVQTSDKTEDAEQASTKLNSSTA